MITTTLLRRMRHYIGNIKLPNRNDVRLHQVLKMSQHRSIPSYSETIQNHKAIGRRMSRFKFHWTVRLIQQSFLI